MPPTPPEADAGFWRLNHDDLAALLARHDLSWETARAYLALADLTLGYGKSRDTVSLGQIARRAGMYGSFHGATLPDCSHVARALRRLAELGLCGQAPARGQSVTRWVIWPAPSTPPEATANVGTPASIGTAAEPGSGTTAGAGSGTTAGAGTSASIGTSAKATAGAGTHQDTKTYKKKKKKKIATDKPPPDSRVKTFLDFFCKAYTDAVGKPYIVNGGKDGATIKRLLRALDGNGFDALAELQRAARNMLADRWGRDKGDIGLLANKINSWWGTGKAGGGSRGTYPAAPVGASVAGLVNRSFAGAVQ